METAGFTQGIITKAHKNLLGICFSTGLLVRLVIVIVLAIHYRRDFGFIQNEKEFFGQFVFLWIIVGFLSVILEFGLSVFSIVTAKLKQKGLDSWAKRSAFMVGLGVVYNAIHIQIYIHSLEQISTSMYWNITITLQFVNLISAALLEASGFFLEDSQAETIETRNRNNETTVSDTVSDISAKPEASREEVLKIVDYIWTGEDGVKVQTADKSWKEWNRATVNRYVKSYEKRVLEGSGNILNNSAMLKHFKEVQGLINGVVNLEIGEQSDLNGVAL